MALTGLLELIKGHREFERHIEEVNAGSSTATIAFRTGTKPAYLAALWLKLQRPILVLTPRPEESRRIYDELITYLGGEDEFVYLLPEPEVLPFERLAVDVRTSNQRLVTLSALAKCNFDEPGQSTGLPPLVVTSIGSALRLTISPETIFQEVSSKKQLRVGSRIGRVDDLLKDWVNLGYRHEPLVESPGRS